MTTQETLGPTAKSMQSTLFIWRKEPFSRNSADLLREYLSVCPFCSSTLLVGEQQCSENANLDAIAWAGASTYSCCLCGWNGRYLPADRFAPSVAEMGILNEFDLNSTRVGLDELGSHLKRHKENIYDLSWRRFEELVADVLREHGLRIVLTKATRDGGADVLLLEGERDRVTAIVECKKFAAERRIGVAAVRQLLGAAVSWDVHRAYLITTSGFSSVARLEAKHLQARGFELDLIDAADFLSLLGVYNAELPRLDQLDAKLRDEVINSNWRRFEQKKT